MVRDTRWPVLPVLILRGCQLFFSIIVLGCAGYVVSVYAYWFASMALVSALFTLIYVPITFFLLFSNLLLPLAIVIVDAVLLVFWLVSMAGFGDSGFLASSCKLLTYDYWGDSYSSGTWIPCEVSKAIFGISFLVFLLFIASLVIAALVLHKNRKDISGAMHNSGMTPDGELQTMGPTSDVPGQPTDAAQQQQEFYGAEQKQDYQQPQQPQYPQQQYQQPGNDGYYHNQQQVPPVVSPPQTPAPYQVPDGASGYTVSPPPPPPPVGTQEMPCPQHGPHGPH